MYAKYVFARPLISIYQQAKEIGESRLIFDNKSRSLGLIFPKAL